MYDGVAGVHSHLDHDGNTCLHYAAAFNNMRLLDIVMQHEETRWYLAVLAVNKLGETPCDMVRGDEAKERFSNLEALAVKQMHAAVAEARSKGSLPDPTQASPPAHPSTSPPVRPIAYVTFAQPASRPPAHRMVFVTRACTELN